MTKQAQKQDSVLPENLNVGDWILFKLDNGEEYIGNILDFDNRWVKIANVFNNTVWVNLSKVMFIDRSSKAEAHINPRARKRYWGE